jgi:hypothetical protein
VREQATSASNARSGSPDRRSSFIQLTGR